MVASRVDTDRPRCHPHPHPHPPKRKTDVFAEDMGAPVEDEGSATIGRVQQQWSAKGKVEPQHPLPLSGVSGGPLGLLAAVQQCSKTVFFAGERVRRFFCGGGGGFEPALYAADPCVFFRGGVAAVAVIVIVILVWFGWYSY